MKTRWKVLLGIVVALAGLRAALPSIVESRLNAKLSRLDGWEARVGDVDLALLRGAVVVKAIKADNEAAGLRSTIERVAVNVSWKDLLRRRLVARIDVDRPSISLVLPSAEKREAAKAKKKEPWPDPNDLFPFRIERFAVRGGEAALTEGEHTTRLTGAYFLVEGLTNVEKDARAVGNAGLDVVQGGTARVDFHLAPAQRPPAFDLNLAVKKVELPPLNPLLRAEFGMDVEKGVFELIAEAESSGGGFKGYVKPFVKDLEMGPLGGKKKGPMKVLKEAAVGAVAAVLENPKTDAVAAKVPFEGRYDDPDIGVWEAFVSVLRNAFIKALTPSFEGIRR